MTAPVSFTVTHRQPGSAARTGLLTTPHGVVHTPAFIAVGTQATVKTLTPDDLDRLGAEIALCNTYHLHLRPGAETVAALGGLHRFMAWDGPIVTDSGGFQVFSLGLAMEHGVGKIAKMFPGESKERPTKPVRPKLAKIDDDGVSFRSHIDGSTHRFTPEVSIQLQEQLGADISLAFDECTSPLSSYADTARALERTHRWAERCLAAHTRPDQALFGIVQGGAYQDLREQSADFIRELPFPGYAIGGSLGKSKADMHAVLAWTIPRLPEDKPRHLLGIGDPEDLVACVARGIDLFDCVAPTRLARHGVLLTVAGRLNIRNARFRLDFAPIEEDCDCPACAQFSRAYLRHLFVANEILGYRLASYHNLRYLLRLMGRIREQIARGEFTPVQGSSAPGVEALAGRGEDGTG